VQPRRQEHAARPPARLRPRAREKRDLHRRRPDLVLERLRRGDPDARPGQLLRPAPQPSGSAVARSRDVEARRVARVPAQPERAARRRRRCRGGTPRARGVQPIVYHLPCRDDGDGQQRGKQAASAVRNGNRWRYAMRTASKAYRTTPLRGLIQHAPYFHDGSAATLDAVVDHYNKQRKLNLTAEQRRDLVEFLKTL